MSRQSVFMLRQNIFFVAIEFSLGWGFLCHDKVFLRHDRVWPRQKVLGCDRVFSYRDGVWGKGQESLRRNREFDVETELLEIVSRQSIPYVAIESSRT